MAVKHAAVRNRIKKHRDVLGYTQKDVAYLLGLQNASSISRWEKGISIPSIVMLLKLSVIFRTLPTELYFELLLNLRKEIFLRESKMSKQSNLQGKPKHY